MDNNYNNRDLIQEIEFLRNRVKELEEQNKNILAMEESLRRSEYRFRTLFENSPLSLWEEDWSAIKEFFNNVFDNFEGDFRVFFDQHPEAIEFCSRLIRIIDINQATLDLHDASTKEELISNLEMIFTSETLDTFKEELVALAEGKTYYENEYIHKTLTGKVRYIALKLIVVPGSEKNLDRILVSMLDITDQKNAEKEREKLIVDIKSALDEVKTLTGLLPICSSCKRIRDDKGYWRQVEVYVQQHSDAEFSHGLCPHCAKELYGKYSK